MRIIIHVGHPGHVYLFKNIIKHIIENGGDVIVTAVEKEFTVYLLEKFKIQYILVGKNKKGLLNKLINLLTINKQIYDISKDFKPDTMLGVAGFNISQVGKLLGIKTIVLDDTEHSTLEILLYRYLATRILTPNSFKKELGSNHIRYNGYHELAYLHPDYFKPDPKVLDNLGLSPKDKIVFFRFVSWNANHDVGHKGLTDKDKLKLVREISKNAKVIISSEKRLPSSFSEFSTYYPPEEIHNLLFYSTLFIGEGATTASECAVLGTPAIYVNSLSLGYLEEQEKSYGLVFNILHRQKIMAKALEILNSSNNSHFNKQRENLLNENINLSDFLINQLNIGT